jgi:hypothetical protein
VGHGGDILYNAVNRAGANKSREVRGPLLAKVLAARRRDTKAGGFKIQLPLSSKISYTVINFILHALKCLKSSTNLIILKLDYKYRIASLLSYLSLYRIFRGF